MALETEIRPAPVAAPAAPVRERLLRRDAWLMPGAVAAAVLLASTALHGIIDGWSWFPAAALTVTAVLAASATARALRRGPLVSLLCGVGALVIVLTVLFLRSSSLLGFLPTPDSWRALSALAGDFQQTVISQVIPVLPGNGVIFFTAATLGLLALLVDVLAVSLAMPAVSGFGLFSVLAIASVIKTNGAGLPAFLAACLGYLILLGAAQWTAERANAQGPGAASAGPPEAGTLRGPVQRPGQGPGVRQSGRLVRRAAALGASALAVSLLLPPAIPGFDYGAFPQGSRLYLWGQPTGLNPILNLGSDLRNPFGAAPVKYYTDSETPLYLRSTTIDELTGERWQPTLQRNARRGGTSSLDVPELNRWRETGDLVRTQIETGNFSSPWLLAPYAPINISGLDGRWSWEPDNLSILAGDGTTTSNQVYAVSSVRPVITAKGLESARRGRFDVDARFSALPGDLPGIIRQTADQVLQGKTSDYDKALALQNFLRGTGFSYSEQAPVQGGYDGNGISVVAAFLEKRSGYCVHYAAAMAVMARHGGIPSRIAVGYSPGSPTGETRPSPGGGELQGFSLTSRNAHAWPELYFEGFGWVPFEPTPGRGAVPGYAPVPELFTGEVQLPEDQMNPTSAPLEPQAAPGPAVPAPGTESGAGGEAVEAPAVQARRILAASGAAAGGLLLLGTPALLRFSRRRRAVGASGRMPEPGAAKLRWQEVLNTAADHGHRPDPAQTAAGFEQRLVSRRLVRGDAEAALARLRREYERAEYAVPVPAGPQPAGPEPAPPGRLRDAQPGLRNAQPAGGQDRAGTDLRIVLAAITAASPWPARLWALLVPASLFHAGNR